MNGWGCVRAGPVASRRGRPARLRGRWAARGGARRRLLAARGTAGPPRHPVPQGRLQPTGPVRLLHRAGRRPAAGGLRDAGPAGRRPAGDHRRRSGGRRSLGRRVHGRGGQPVRVLHAGDRRAPGRRERAWTADRGHGRSGAPRPPLPVHGLADDPGGGPRDGAGTAGAGPGSPLGGRRGAPGEVGGSRAAGRGRRGGAGAGRLRGRHRAARRARRGAFDRRGLGGRRDAHRGPRRGRQGAGSEDDRPAALADRAAGGGVGPHAAHDVGRARLSGDRRVVVRPRRRAGDGARQRRGVRRQGHQRGRGGRSPARGRARPPGPRPVRARGRRALGSEATTARGRGAGRRQRCGARGPDHGRSRPPSSRRRPDCRWRRST